MKPNKNKNTIIISVIGLVFLILVVSMWVVPASVYAYEGDGEVYVPSESQVSTEKNTTTDPPQDSGNSQLNKMKDEARKLIAGVNPERFNNSDIPAGVKSFGNSVVKYQVTICNSLFYLLMSFAGFWMLHGILAICSDAYFQFFAKFKYNMFSKNVFKMKAEDGVVPEGGNRNNGNNGMNNGYNTQYNSQNYNRNQQQNNGNNNGMNNNNGGGMASVAKEKLSVPIQILKYLAAEAITLVILTLCLTAIKTGVLVSFIFEISIWVIDAFDNISKGVGSL